MRNVLLAPPSPPLTLSLPWRIFRWVLHLFSPHTCLKLTLYKEELPQLLAIGGLGEHAGLFPHTHKQAGGPSASLTDSFLQQLSQEEVEQVKEVFKVDMQLFGYT